MNSAETNTTLLVKQLKEGSIKAYDALFWHYHQPIYRNILKLVKEADVAQDILQEVFITLWEKRYQIDTSQSVSGWLFVVSFNLSITHTRKILREQLLLDELSLNILDDESENTMLVESQYQLLNQAMEKLSPQKRKVFTLCKLEGKTYEQAAEELSISKHTVKEYLSLAMISVKDYVKQHTGDGNKAVLLAFISHWI